MWCRCLWWESPAGWHADFFFLSLRCQWWLSNESASASSNTYSPLRSLNCKNGLHRWHRRRCVVWLCGGPLREDGKNAMQHSLVENPQSPFFSLPGSQGWGISLIGLKQKESSVPFFPFEGTSTALKTSSMPPPESQRPKKFDFQNLKIIWRN